jgi:hypothetical protein
MGAALVLVMPLTCGHYSTHNALDIRAYLNTKSLSKVTSKSLEAGYIFSLKSGVG